MQILDDLEHAESEDAEEDELEDVMYDIEDSFEDEETGDTGFGAVLAVIMRRETGLTLSSTLQRMTSGRTGDSVGSDVSVDAEREGKRNYGKRLV